MSLLLPMAKPAPTSPQPAAVACARLGQRPLRALLGAVLLLTLAACQPQADRAAPGSPPPVGHYEGSIAPAGQPAVRVALDIRYPSAGHCEGEVTVAGRPELSFLTDTLRWQDDTLRVARPTQPEPVLSLRLEGEFWQGHMLLDGRMQPVVLIRRGPPEPASYQLRRLYLSPATVVQFLPPNPAITGPAVLMLTDSMGPASAVWADFLARQDVMAQLPITADAPIGFDSVSSSYLRFYLNFQRFYLAVDAPRLGLWLHGRVGRALPAVLADTSGHLPTLAFVLLLHPPPVPARDRAAWQRLGRRLPILALYHQSEARAAASMQAALGSSRRGRAVRRYPATAAGTAQMQADALGWLRQVPPAPR